jgi:signal peptidase I
MNPEQTPPSQSTPPQKPVVHGTRQAALQEFLSTAGVLLMALLIAVTLIAFVFQSYQVDGESMQNTLHNNDRLIVWKTPRTWARITHHQYVPKRGDIIIFNETGLSSYGQDDSKQLVKRVIGLPGDRVVVKDGVITIYNTANPDGFQPDKDLPYGSATTIPYTSGDIDVRLGSDQLFVCGDNRSNSLDSRIFGPIKTNQIIGKLAARIYPFSDAEKF